MPRLAISGVEISAIIKQKFAAHDVAQVTAMSVRHQYSAHALVRNGMMMLFALKHFQ
jgi:hypothetical protein